MDTYYSYGRSTCCRVNHAHRVSSNGGTERAKKLLLPQHETKRVTASRQLPGRRENVVRRSLSISTRVRRRIHRRWRYLYLRVTCSPPQQIVLTAKHVIAIDWPALQTRNNSLYTCVGRQPIRKHPDVKRRCYCAFSFSVNSGTFSKRSPTNPTSATWKIGASGSLLIAAITLLSFMPARC